MTALQIQNYSTVSFVLTALSLVAVALTVAVGLRRNRLASIAVGIFILAIMSVHAYRISLLEDQLQQMLFIVDFAFIPTRYLPSLYGIWATSG